MATEEYERYRCEALEREQGGGDEVDEGVRSSYDVESEVVQFSLRALYASAGEELDVPIERCRIPAVLIHKYLKLSVEDKKKYEGEIVDAINAKEQERLKLKLAMKKETSEDYAKGFGGTEADSKNEREAAALLRGDISADDTGSDICPHLTPPRIENTLQHLWLKKIGKWKKFSGADCVMYINVLSRDIGSRPADYEDEVEVYLLLQADILGVYIL